MPHLLLKLGKDERSSVIVHHEFELFLKLEDLVVGECVLYLLSKQFKILFKVFLVAVVLGIALYDIEGVRGLDNVAVFLIVKREGGVLVYLVEFASCEVVALTRILIILAVATDKALKIVLLVTLPLMNCKACTGTTWR